ncbi:peptidase inhibitor family I36 protein [Streptomyces sp. NPDC048172]|uniref:peptidase inhibitor family I36 protein n=1 Tax=Streptomyces sp. NPDC048172 TaxID=3365505 RepID=UPI0037166705
MPKHMSARGSKGSPVALGSVAAGVLAVAALAAVIPPAGAASAPRSVPEAAPGAAPGAAHAAGQPKLGKCAAGELCLWDRTGFRGERRTYELSGIDIESCVPLPKGTTAASLGNRTGRPVTLYQSRECAETGEFVTHPTGSWTPETAYRGRAFKVWEN